MSGPKLKTLLLLVVPLVIAGFLITFTSVSTTKRQLELQADHYGNTIAEQLALSIVEPMMRKDVLSINVVLSDLRARGNFQFASVYSANNKLLAQAGKNRDDLTMFTKDIVFQNAFTGYVQLGLDPAEVVAPLVTTISAALAIELLLIALLTIAVWFYGDMLFMWWSEPASLSDQSKPADNLETKSESEFIEDITGDVSILVIKIRPERQLEANLDKITSALSLYRGEVEITEGDDIVVTFGTSNQVFEGVCCGLLISCIMQRVRGNCQVKLGMHVASLAEGDSIANARKQATYLSSISEGALLTSRKVFAKVTDIDLVPLVAYQSSLTPDGEVYCLQTLGPDNQQLIERQAAQFF